jgi:hypothetical protein
MAGSRTAKGIGAVAKTTASNSSYVGDRLNALLRLPSDERPAVTVIGQELDHHAILVGSIRFGASGPLYQLFPIALVRALEALIQSRPVPPRPPSDLPPLTERSIPTARRRVLSLPLSARRPETVTLLLSRSGPLAV